MSPVELSEIFNEFLRIVKELLKSNFRNCQGNLENPIKILENNEDFINGIGMFKNHMKKF